MMKYICIILLLLLIFYILNLYVNSIYFKLNFITDEYLEHFISYK